MQPRATLAEGAARRPSTQVVPRQSAQEALTREAARPSTQKAVVEPEAARPSTTDRHGKLYGNLYGKGTAVDYARPSAQEAARQIAPEVSRTMRAVAFDAAEGDVG